jgi:hypothetical protein
MGGTVPTHILVREHLEPLLGDHGFSLVHEEYHPRAFGNGYSKYQCPGGELRVIFDGKESQVILDYVKLNDEGRHVQGSYQDIHRENIFRYLQKLDISHILLTKNICSDMVSE